MSKIPTRRETQIKNINTLIERCALLISHYNRTHQRVLKNFHKVFESISTQKPLFHQKIFKKRLKRFDKKYRFTKIYYRLGFLWYACDFCNLIYMRLLFGSESLGFIHSILRETYHLIERKVALTNESEWDKLQKKCLQSRPPVLHEQYGDEIQIFDRLHSLQDRFGLGALNPRHIHDTLRPSIPGPPWSPTLQEQVELFFELSQTEWFLHFFPAAFLLSWVFFNIKVLNKKGFKKLQSVFESENAQVCQVIYGFSSVGEQEESFVGWVNIPQGCFNRFRKYLGQWEGDGIIEVIECEETNDFKHSISYTFYRQGEGWSYQGLDLTNLPTSNVLSTKPWKSNWSCLNSRQTAQIIDAFCEYRKVWSYEDLCDIIGDINRNQDKTRLFGSYNRIMWNFFERDVFQIKIQPRGLLRSYSLQDYLVFVPRNASKQDILKFTSIVPYTLSLELQNSHVRIFCYLDDFLADFIRKKMKWQSARIQQSLAQPKPFQRSWFDFDALQWKRPKFLQNKASRRLDFS